MWHNDEIMTGWREVMTAEEFEAKEAKKIGETLDKHTAVEEGHVLFCCYDLEQKKQENILSWDEIKALPYAEHILNGLSKLGEEKSTTVLDEMATITERDYVRVALMYKIEKKLHKMGFTYDEELCLTLGLEENIRVYTGVEYTYVFNRLRDCYATKLSEDNTVSLYRKFEGRETEIDIDEFLIGEK